jgi:Zn-dependent protease with chaperone function
MTPRFLAALAACVLVAACAEPPRQAASPAPVRAGGQAMNFLAVQARVEPVAEAECARRNPRANCDFRIIVDDRPGMPPNAYQTLDRAGRPLLGFTTSLVARIHNQDELALIMAHEAAHHIAGHLSQQNQYASMGAAAYGHAASRTEGATAATVQQAQMIGAQLAVRTYSKNWELEADRLGARVAAQAGYDPIRGAEFFRRIPDPGNRAMGTHPANEERIAAVHSAMRR